MPGLQASLRHPGQWQRGLLLRLLLLHHGSLHLWIQHARSHCLRSLRLLRNLLGLLELGDVVLVECHLIHSGRRRPGCCGRRAPSCHAWQATSLEELLLQLLLHKQLLQVSHPVQP